MQGLIKNSKREPSFLLDNTRKLSRTTSFHALTKLVNVSDLSSKKKRNSISPPEEIRKEEEKLPVITLWEQGYLDVQEKRGVRLLKSPKKKRCWVTVDTKDATLKLFQDRDIEKPFQVIHLHGATVGYVDDPVATSQDKRFWVKEKATGLNRKSTLMFSTPSTVRRWVQAISYAISTCSLIDGSCNSSRCSSSDSEEDIMEDAVIVKDEEKLFDPLFTRSPSEGTIRVSDPNASSFEDEETNHPRRRLEVFSNMLRTKAFTNPSSKLGRTTTTTMHIPIKDRMNHYMGLDRKGKKQQQQQFTKQQEPRDNQTINQTINQNNPNNNKSLENSNCSTHSSTTTFSSFCTNTKDAMNVQENNKDDQVVDQDDRNHSFASSTSAAFSLDGNGNKYQTTFFLIIENAIVSGLKFLNFTSIPGQIQDFLVSFSLQGVPEYILTLVFLLLSLVLGTFHTSLFTPFALSGFYCYCLPTTTNSYSFYKDSCTPYYELYSYCYEKAMIHFSLVFFTSLRIPSIRLLFTFIVGVLWETAKAKHTHRIEFKKNIELGIQLEKKLFPHLELPCWIKDPSANRVEWLNHILERWWPYLKDATKHSLMDMLNPLVETQRPSYISALKFEEIEFGDSPPLITGIKVIEIPHTEAQISIEVEIKYSGKHQIAAFKVISTLGVAATIKLTDLVIMGTIRLSFNSLSSEWPCVRTLGLSLINKPFIDFSMSAAKLNVTNMPFASDWLRVFLKDTLIEHVVWPRQVEIPLYIEPTETTATSYPNEAVIHPSSRESPETETGSPVATPSPSSSSSIPQTAQQEDNISLLSSLQASLNHIGASFHIGSPSQQPSSGTSPRHLGWGSGGTSPRHFHFGGPTSPRHFGGGWGGKSGTAEGKSSPRHPSGVGIKIASPRHPSIVGDETSLLRNVVGDSQTSHPSGNGQPTYPLGDSHFSNSLLGDPHISNSLLGDPHFSNSLLDDPHFSNPSGDAQYLSSFGGGLLHHSGEEVFLQPELLSIEVVQATFPTLFAGMSSSLAEVYCRLSLYEVNPQQNPNQLHSQLVYTTRVASNQLQPIWILHSSQWLHFEIVSTCNQSNKIENISFASTSIDSFILNKDTTHELSLLGSRRGNLKIITNRRRFSKFSCKKVEYYDDERTSVHNAPSLFQSSTYPYPSDRQPYDGYLFITLHWEGQEKDTLHSSSLELTCGELTLFSHSPFQGSSHVTCWFPIHHPESDELTLVILDENDHVSIGSKTYAVVRIRKKECLQDKWKLRNDRLLVEMEWRSFEDSLLIQEFQGDSNDSML